MATERPLDQIRRDTKKAHRAPHLRKHSMVPVDVIDSLDTISIGGPYHHEGPYDATLAPRNRNRKYAPVEAVREGNLAALRATPQEHIMDSLSRHVPLQGTATIPPGHKDFVGRTMDYEEGADLMREPDAGGGAYRRWKDYDYVSSHPSYLTPMHLAMRIVPVVAASPSPSFLIPSLLLTHPNYQLGARTFRVLESIHPSIHR
jgi:hypothetical protein